MRKWLVLLLLVTPALAHDDHGTFETGDEAHGLIEHTRLVSTELGANGSANWTLAYQGGPLDAGWRWLLRADVIGAVRVDIFLDERHLTTWNWATGPHIDERILPREGLIDLYVTNLQEDNSTFTFYFDQTCECLGKVIPLNSGPVWFNPHAETGETVRVNFTIIPTSAIALPPSTLPDTLKARATYYRIDEFGGRVDEVRVRADMHPKNDTACHEAGIRWNGCIEIEFTALYDGPQLVWFDVIHDGDTSWDMAIQPIVEVEAPSQSTPMPWYAGLALLGVALYRRAK